MAGGEAFCVSFMYASLFLPLMMFSHSDNTQEAQIAQQELLTQTLDKESVILLFSTYMHTI